ncbi:hypothetical protein LOTGIDRAFT_152177 [Lottia gigantea]|uniref:Uncharacterized protein n=1 Tax=Lottia gigantea TaxID=225164 RepID=V4BCH9_LOTGI|nr:hypothetical protein LOTGIDRAFT_152177 [Lottia gigantea]ESP05336.1 hypothetical protein LOTGIDRAFT_152177 [Lottia gigantea]
MIGNMNRTNGEKSQQSLWKKLTEKVIKDYSNAYRPTPNQNQPPTGSFNGEIMRAPPAMYHPPTNNPRQPTIYNPASTSPEHSNQQNEVSIENVEYLSDGDFFQLGIICMGDKCRLKSRCVKLTQGLSDKFVFHGEDNYEELVEEHYTEEIIKPNTASSQTGQTELTAGNALSPGSEIQVEMGAEARFEMGDKDNVVKTEQSIKAEYIGTVIKAFDTGGTTEHDPERPTSGKESKLTVKMEERAVFETGNKNNVIENLLKVEANEINNVGRNQGPSGSGLPGIPNLGGNINITLGENAACNLGNNMANIERKPDRWKKERLREAFKNEFGSFIFKRLIQIYNQPFVQKKGPVRIKPEVKKGKTLDQEEWNVLIYEQMIKDTFEELYNLVAELSKQPSAAGQQKAGIVEVNKNNERKESGVSIVELKKDTHKEALLKSLPKSSRSHVPLATAELSKQPSAAGQQKAGIVEVNKNNERKESGVSIVELKKDKHKEALLKSLPKSSRTRTSKKPAHSVEYRRKTTLGIRKTSGAEKFSGVTYNPFGVEVTNVVGRGKPTWWDN